MRVAIFLALLAGPAVAQDCQNPATQLAMNTCADQAFQVADSDLNRAYGVARDILRQIDADLPPAQRGAELALRDGQRAWITFRDQSCLAESYQNFGGSIRPMVYSLCQARVTQQRAADLWALAR